MNKILFTALTAIITISLTTAMFARDYKETEDVINQILEQNKHPEQTPPKQDDQEEDEEEANQKPKKNEKKAKTSSTAADEMSLYKIGIQFYEASLFDNALKYFNDLLDKYPQSQYSDSTKIWKGKTLSKKYAFKDAVTAFSSVSESSGEYPAALFNTGLSYIYLKQPNEAIAVFQKLIIRFPDNSLTDNALLESAKIFLSQKNGEKAIDSLVKIIKLYHDRETIAEAYYHLAKVFEQDQTMRNIESARNLLKQFLKKAEQGEKFFKDSPLKEKVLSDLNYIEKNYFKYEN